MQKNAFKAGQLDIRPLVMINLYKTAKMLLLTEMPHFKLAFTLLIYSF